MLVEKLEGEEWRPIVDPPTDERYRISNKGRVYDTVGEKFLNWHDNGGGYKIVGLRRKGHVNTLMRYVHRLVGIHFIDNPNNHPQVGHKDHDKENNDVSNLYWTTQKQNTRDGIKAGRINVKERPYTKRLSPRHICAIAIMEHQGYGVNEIAQELDFPRTTISSVFNKKSNWDLFCFAREEVADWAMQKKDLALQLETTLNQKENQ